MKAYASPPRPVLSPEGEREPECSTVLARLGATGNHPHTAIPLTPALFEISCERTVAAPIDDDPYRPALPAPGADESLRLSVVLAL